MKGKTQTQVVKKELSPDEKTLLNNCMTMLQEIAQMNAGDTSGEADANAAKDDESDEVTNKESNPGDTDAAGRDPEDKKKKSENKVDENAGTASDDAEERIEGVQADTSIAGANEAKKALAALLALVGKSAAPVQTVGKQAIDPNLVLMKGMLEEIKAMKSQNEALANTMGALLEGIGISEKSFEDLEKAKSSEKVAKSKGSVPAESAKALEELIEGMVAKAAGAGKAPTTPADSKTLTKGLMRTLRGI